MLFINPQNLKPKIQKSEGISLLFVILIMSVILSIGLGISAILVQQTKMMRTVGHSVVSFYAADTGIEQELYELYKTEPPYNENYSGFCGDASFKGVIKCGAAVDVAACPDGLQVASSPQECDALNLCLESIGSYQKTKRAIEIKY